MTHSYVFSTRTGWLCLLFIWFAFATAHAQFVDDPLNKPEQWVKVKQAPHDLEVWANYYGKKWILMTPAEQQQVLEWKHQLLLQEIADKEAIVTSIEHQASKSSPTPSPTTELPAKALADVEAFIREEQKGLAELKSNINENFVILEDMYRDIFKDLGVTYIPYEKKHPKGDYSRVKWIEEQEMQIKILKENKIKQIRSQLLSNQH
ncbi:MAG: hypothetical protein RMJ87_09365 [Cytophagales bacterium]|nr:hypothetical protein [Bernardetiaceae bacterium]MDW8205224.1 hypothetical protein [Cytophagales bacterium]